MFRESCRSIRLRGRQAEIDDRAGGGARTGMLAVSHHAAALYPALVLADDERWPGVRDDLSAWLTSGANEKSLIGRHRTPRLEPEGEARRQDSDPAHAGRSLRRRSLVGHIGLGVLGGRRRICGRLPNPDHILGEPLAEASEERQAHEEECFRLAVRWDLEWDQTPKHEDEQREPKRTSDDRSERPERAILG